MVKICKGTCIQYEPQKLAHYRNGYRRCQICNVFIKWDGVYCPCCGMHLRTKARGYGRKEFHARLETLGEEGRY